MSLSGLKPSDETEAQARERLGRPSPQHRYCEDCKFFSANALGVASSDECLYPIKVAGRDFIRRAAVRTRICSSERNHETEDSCGLDAKWFQPKGDAL